MSATSSGNPPAGPPTQAGDMALEDLRARPVEVSRPGQGDAAVSRAQVTSPAAVAFAGSRAGHVTNSLGDGRVGRNRQSRHRLPPTDNRQIVPADAKNLAHIGRMCRGKRNRRIFRRYVLFDEGGSAT